MNGFDSDDEDKITCKHCGLSYYPEVGMGHICQEGIEASRKETEESDRRYKGTGNKIKVSIQIDIECYDSPEAVDSALNIITFSDRKPLNENETFFGRDNILDCKYKMVRKII